MIKRFTWGAVGLVMNNNDVSRRIGSVLGPTLIMVIISEWINYGIFLENNPPHAYLNGVMLFAVGVAIVRFHNAWRPLWTLSITVTGWLMLAGGVFRLFFPTAPQAPPGLATYGFMLFLGALGLMMTVKSYTK